MELVLCVCVFHVFARTLGVWIDDYSALVISELVGNSITKEVFQLERISWRL